MNSETSDAQTDGSLPTRRLDRVSVLLAIITIVLVGWTAWLRFGPGARPQPPAIGQALPPLRLLDITTAEPLVLLGSKGKVTWVVFWSAASRSGITGLANLEPVWKRLKSHRRLTLVTVATNSDQPDRVRAALVEIHATMPAYLASPETLRRIGLERVDPPRPPARRRRRSDSRDCQEWKSRRDQPPCRASRGLARGDRAARKHAVRQYATINRALP